MEIQLETVTLTPKTMPKWDAVFATAKVGDGRNSVPAGQMQTIRQAAKRVLNPRGLTVSFRTLTAKTDANGKVKPETVKFAVVEQKAESTSA